MKGRLAEEIVKMRYLTRWYEVKRTGKGHDYYVRKKDPWTGRIIDEKFIEVKANKSRLSKLQQKMKKRKRNYKVERVDFFF